MNENPSQIFIDELEHALKIAARVVSLFGECYLPIFNRIYFELNQAKEKQDQKSLALQLAMNYSK